MKGGGNRLVCVGMSLVEITKERILIYEMFIKTDLNLKLNCAKINSKNNVFWFVSLMQINISIFGKSMLLIQTYNSRLKAGELRRGSYQSFFDPQGRLVRGYFSPARGKYGEKG